MSKVTTLPAKHGGSKRKRLFNKIKLHWEKKNLIHWKMVSCFPFYIIPRFIWDHCRIGSWISKTLFLNVWEGVSKRVLCDLVHFGILSDTKKHSKSAYQPNLAEFCFILLYFVMMNLISVAHHSFPFWPVFLNSIVVSASAMISDRFIYNTAYSLYSLLYGCVR